MTIKKNRVLKPKLICVRCKGKTPVLLHRYGTKGKYFYNNIPEQEHVSQEIFDYLYPDCKIEIIPGNAKFLLIAKTGTLYTIEK